MKSRTFGSNPSQNRLFATCMFTDQPRIIGYMWVVTSVHFARLPDIEPVTAQSATLRWSAGITSENEMVTATAPTASANSAMVFEKTRIFLPLRSLMPLIGTAHQMTWPPVGHITIGCTPVRDTYLSSITGQ